jgi:hypothetical protein
MVTAKVAHERSNTREEWIKFTPPGMGVQLEFKL